MKLFATIGTVAAIAAATITLAPAPAQAASPITIQQCFVTPPRLASSRASGTQIDFVNNGRQAAKLIRFAVVYRNAVSTYARTVIDQGTFSPGVTIKNHFQLFNDVTYAGKNVRSCGAVEVKWADGTTWVANH